MSANIGTGSSIITITRVSKSAPLGLGQLNLLSNKLGVESKSQGFSGMRAMFHKHWHIGVLISMAELIYKGDMLPFDHATEVLA